MEGSFKISCGRCGREFKFRVTVPGERIPTIGDAYLALHVEGTGFTLTGNASVPEEDKRQPLSICSASDEKSGHRLGPPQIDN
jgi:hypothetical protein